MFSFKIRCRYILRYNKVYRLRHYSFINNSKKSQNLEPLEAEENINNDVKNSIQKKPSVELSQNKLSNVVSSFLNCSLNSLEDYIIKQAPTKVDNETNNFNNNIFEIDSHQSNNTFIPYQMSLLNKNYNEFINLTNPEHIKGLLSINKKIWFNHSPELEQYINRTSNINLPLILNYYIRSLPEIKTQLTNPNLNTKIGINTFRLIISILINSQWFHSASYIIMRMNLPFNDLVNFINSLLDNELIFQKSDWLRYIFIINFYQFYKNINPLIITNIDCLSNSLNLNRFKLLNMLWKNKYFSLSEINGEINDCNEVIPNDNLINLMHIYKSIDAIKYQYPFDLTKQLSHFKVLISSNLNGFNSQYFLSTFLSNLLSLNEFEFEYIQSSNLSTSEIESFISERKNSIFFYLIIKKQSNVKSFDSLTILKSKPNLDISLKLWDYHLLNMNNNLQNTIYYKSMILYFVEQLKNTKKYSDILNTEFSNLSSSKKINIISSNLFKYLKHDNFLTKNRVGGYIALTNNQVEHAHVMKQIIMNLFNQNNQFNYPDLLKVLELIAIFSPTLLNKESLFELSCQIIEKNQNNKEFQFFEQKEIFDRTLKFLELIKSIDSSSKSYIKSFIPVLIKYYNDYINTLANQNLSDLILLKGTKDLCYHLNRTFDIICKKSKELTILNPKNYNSKIYIQNQALLQKISIELFKLPSELILNILKSRANWICMDQNDWIFIFHQKIFIFGVFLEILFRKSIRDFNDSVKFSKFNDLEFEKALKNEMNKLSLNETNWELVERLAGFEWNKELSSVFFNNESNENNEKYENDENDENDKLGDGIIMVLNEIEKINGKNFTDRFKMINELKNKNVNEVESFNNITDALFDSINESSNEVENDIDLLNLINQNNQNNDDEKKLSKSLLTQDSLEFNELYKDMKKYELFIPDDKIDNIGNYKIHKNNKNKNEKKSVRMKKKYNLKEKERLIRLYSPLRFKCKLIQSLIEQKPELVDALIRRLFIEYRDRIPISLIHSLMIGLIQSNKKKIGFNEKINLIKILDKIVTIIYSTASNKVHSYLFMYFVRFKDFRISLVDLVINESQISNSGSLKTLYWAINKITNTTNMNEYKNEFTRWTNELNNMKESKTGFWNPQNKGKWIKVEDI